MNTEKISIKSIIDDYIAKTGNTEIEPNQILRFANDALDRILPGEEFLHNIALIDVNDYKAPLPANFKYVLQAAYLIDKPVYRSEHIVEYTKKIYGSDCKLNLEVHCDNCGDYDTCNSEVITMDVDHNYLLKHPEYMYKHANHFYSGRTLDGPKPHCTLHPEFQLMRRTSNYFYNVPYHVNECININADTHIEYDIHLPNILVNFKKGQILIAYLGSNVDKDGYLMIPNIPVVYDAVIQWIEERLAYIDYRKNKEQKDRIFWQQALELRDKKIKQARSYLSTPSSDEWEVFIRNHWIRKVPNYKWEAHHNSFLGDKTASQNYLIPKF